MYKVRKRKRERERQRHTTHSQADCGMEAFLAVTVDHVDQKNSMCQTQKRMKESSSTVSIPVFK